MQRNDGVVQGYGRIIPAMGHFFVDVDVRAQPDLPASHSVRALVDTGSEYTWLPADLLDTIGVARRSTMTFNTASGELVERETGWAFLGVGSWETTDVVVFGASGDSTLLGAHTLEGFNVYVDPVAKRLVPGGPLPVPANLIVDSSS